MFTHKNELYKAKWKTFFGEVIGSMFLSLAFSFRYVSMPGLVTSGSC